MPVSRHLVPVLASTLLALSAFADPQTAYKGHGAESVPAEVIAAYAPKPLPPVGDHVKPSRFGPTRAIAHLGRVEV